jgi:hypothetical protein
MRFMWVPREGFSIETKPAGRFRRCLDETPVSYTREERSWMSAAENFFKRLAGRAAGKRYQLALASTARPI